MTAPPALLYAGRVMHVRHTPFRHRFAYRIWMLCVDLDRIDEAAGASRLFRHNRRGIVSLRDSDHGPRDGGALRPWVERALADAGLPACGARIRFMFIPRVLGYAFNPIAFFFCYDAAGRLGAVLHQVKNTFGGQIGYLLPVADAPGPVRQEAAKHLHVSPFFDMAGGYRFTFTGPGEAEGDRFALSIRYGAEVPRMTATMALTARPMRDGVLSRLLLAMPLMPMKVVAAIHWHALRVWMGGARYQPVPPAPVEAVISGGPHEPA